MLSLFSCLVIVGCSSEQQSATAPAQEPLPMLTSTAPAMRMICAAKDQSLEANAMTATIARWTIWSKRIVRVREYTSTAMPTALAMHSTSVLMVRNPA